MSKVKDILGFVPTIYLDDGHGEDTPGKRTPELPEGGVILENEFNRMCMDYLAKFAEEIGFRVVKVAPELEDVPLQTRVGRANADYAKTHPTTAERPDKAAAYVSVHFNAFRGVWDQTKGGAETHYYPTSARGKLLAEKVQHWLFHGTEQVNRGVKATNFYVLRETAMPAILVECGFMDVLKEARLMKCAEFQKEQAQDILRGICDYYGLDYIALRDSAKSASKQPDESKEIKDLKKIIADLEAENEKLKKKIGDAKKKADELSKALA